VFQEDCGGTWNHVWNYGTGKVNKNIRLSGSSSVKFKLYDFGNSYE
jgi:hypothetical protein